MKPTQNSGPRLAALLSLLVLPIVLVAAQGPEKPQGKPEGRPEAREHAAGGGSIEDSMQVLQGSSKRMEKALEKKEMATVLKLAVDMQRAAHDAKLGTPEKAGTITDAKEKDAFVKGFRKEMIALERALLELEVAALDDKADEAAKVFNSSVKPLKKAGHDKYKDN